MMNLFLTLYFYLFFFEITIKKSCRTSENVIHEIAKEKKKNFFHKDLIHVTIYKVKTINKISFFINLRKILVRKRNAIHTIVNSS